MATTIPCKIHIPFRLPRPLNPTKPPASKTARPANCELVDGRADPSTYPPLLSLKSAAATRPNLHSLNSWPAVQCNEGFCNASEGQRLPLTTTMASQKPHHSANSTSLPRANAAACPQLAQRRVRKGQRIAACSSKQPPNLWPIALALLLGRRSEHATSAFGGRRHAGAERGVRI